MSISIIIENSKPEVIAGSLVSIDIDKAPNILTINYQVLKGDIGPAGSDANVDAHLDMYDHGDLHEHTNKSVLDLISYNAPELLYNGQAIQNATYEGFGDAIALINSTLADLEARLYAIEHP